MFRKQKTTFPRAYPPRAESCSTRDLASPSTPSTFCAGPGKYSYMPDVRITFAAASQRVRLALDASLRSENVTASDHELACHAQ
jgi:hypothetical protein